MYCPECGEPMDDCRCELESERTSELMFDEDDPAFLFGEEEA